METNANQKVSCIVNYAYDASEPDELTIRPGEVLRDVERLSGGWWRGELRGRKGMFPDNFVSLLTDSNNVTTRSSSGVQGRCRAVFSYQPANPDELPLCVGDVLEVLGEVEEGWWQGRRQGRLGVFPSNFVVMLDPAPPAPVEPAPALPPKPVKEQCRVLFPYTAVNEDELSLAEGDIVTITSKDAPDRGWWRGELHGRVGLFPDNFVQIISSTVPQEKKEVEEKKPERPPSKTGNSIYPILNKYSEKTTHVKELTTTKTSMHKENSLGKESSTQITHTNKNDSEKLIHSESLPDGQDGSLKKPPVPLKKSPTPSTGVGGLFSGLKSKMLSATDKEKSSTTVTTTAPVISATAGSGSGNAGSGSGSGSSGEWDRLDGSAASAPAKPASTFDHVERNSILNDPRAQRSDSEYYERQEKGGYISDDEIPRPLSAKRSKPPVKREKRDKPRASVDRASVRVKAPRRRPPSQALRDDTPLQLGLSNGHEAEKPAAEKEKEKAEEIKPRAREWEKHKAPWMEELKLNQAKKGSFAADGKARSVSSSSEGGPASKAGGGSTDRILECGLEDKRSSNSMEMSKSTSSISSKFSVVESFEESTKVRHSMDPKKETPPPVSESAKPTVQSPTAAGRTLTTMLEEIKKPQAPQPPSATARTFPDEKSPHRLETSLDKHELPNHKHTVDKEEPQKLERPTSIGDKVSTLERRIHASRNEKGDSNADVLIAQLNNRISNLEKLLEVQNAKFNAAIEELTAKLAAETAKRQALQAEMEKLAHCVTQV